MRNKAYCRSIALSQAIVCILLAFRADLHLSCCKKITNLIQLNGLICQKKRLIVADHSDTISLFSHYL